MVTNVGWAAKFPAKGSLYSRWVDRKNKRGINYVDKHSGYVYRTVVRVNGKWEGRGFLGVEPKYGNLSGNDHRLESSPNITQSQLATAKRTGRTISITALKFRKPIQLRFKKLNSAHQA